MAAPLGCGVQTGAGTVLNVLAPPRDASLVVFGAGGVGLSAVMAAFASGVGTIIAVDPVAHRRGLAVELGATAALDPAAVDVVDAIRELSGGGATHAIDTTAKGAVINQAITALAPLGTLALVGIRVAGLRLGPAEPDERREDRTRRDRRRRGPARLHPPAGRAARGRDGSRSRA